MSIEVIRTPYGPHSWPDLYYLAFPNDGRWTKAIVYFAYIIGTIQTGFALRDFYVLFCTSEVKLLMEPWNFDTHRFGFMWFTIPVGGALGMLNLILDFIP